jgi:hypothetical protein
MNKGTKSYTSGNKIIYGTKSYTFRNKNEYYREQIKQQGANLFMELIF